MNASFFHERPSAETAYADDFRIWPVSQQWLFEVVRDPECSGRHEIPVAFGIAHADA
jgi:hypothetical protein